MVCLPIILSHNLNFLNLDSALSLRQHKHVSHFRLTQRMLVRWSMTAARASQATQSLIFPLGFISCQLCVPQGVNHPTGSPDKEQMRISLPAEWRENRSPAVIWSEGTLVDFAPRFGSFPLFYPLIWPIRLGTRFLSGKKSRPSAFLFRSSCLTVHWCPLGKDGDGSLGHSLLANHGRDFGSPAVGAHPQEVARLVAPLCRIQNSSGQRRGKTRRKGN